MPASCSPRSSTTTPPASTSTPRASATTIVPAIDSDNGGPVFLPTPGQRPSQARWGGVAVPSGTRTVIDEVNFLYGGGP